MPCFFARSFWHVHAVGSVWDQLGFPNALALQIERRMRRKLKPFSVRRALFDLQEIKVGELALNGMKGQILTKRTQQQKGCLALLGPLPPLRFFREAYLAVQNKQLDNSYTLFL